MVQTLVTNRNQADFVLLVRLLLLAADGLAHPLTLHYLVLSLQEGYFSEKSFAKLRLQNRPLDGREGVSLLSDFELEFVCEVVHGDGVVRVDGVLAHKHLHLVLVGVVADAHIYNFLAHVLDMI